MLFIVDHQLAEHLHLLLVYRVRLLKAVVQVMKK